MLHLETPRDDNDRKKAAGDKSAASSGGGICPPQPSISSGNIIIGPLEVGVACNPYLIFN
jgi:hypothetical protein